MSSTIRTWAVGVSVAALVTAANGSQGGYFSQSWGWIALAFIAAVSLALIVGWSTSPGPLRLAFGVLLAAFGLWTALSATWSLSAAGSMREAERMLVYVALAAAVAFVVRRRDAVGVAAGIFAGSVAVAGYALATRVFPDRFDSYDDPALSYRLAEPIGYWNGLGLLATIATILGIGLVAHGRRWPAVMVAGATLPAIAATLYFTFSRGAWAALAVGVVAMVALDPRRLRLMWSIVAVAPASAICVAVASQYEALTNEGAARADAVSEGHGFAAVVGVLAVVSALLALAAHWSSRRIPTPGWAARVVNAGLAACVVLGVVGALVLVGGPRDALAEIGNRFDATAQDDYGGDLNKRLFTVSGNGRAESIRVAWDAGSERPVLGHGAGSYEYLWYEQRPNELVIRDAHSLYAETFAELGVVGIVLLGLALLLPLAAAVRARRNRVVPASAAAYVAWLAAAGLDWHWELVGVTMTALLAGGVVLLSAERGTPRPLSDAVRWPLLAGAVVLTVFALVSLVGNQALFAGREALAREEWDKANDHGHRAELLLPWSFEPHIVRGDAAARSGDRVRAVAQYRQAVEIDPRNWVAWHRLGQVARGAERLAAYRRVHELNPREENLPGEPDGESP